ncbi:MAG: GNAT family N-acyltransferase [Pseudomonadota bacterium]
MAADPSVWELDDVLQYLRSTHIELPQSVYTEQDSAPLAPAVAPQELAAQLAALPAGNLMHTYRQFSIYALRQHEAPQVLDEVTRLRELTFRAYQEGSGLARDTDRWDADYVHLVAWDNDAQKILGGYRLGRTDELRATGDPQAVYLATMFDFSEVFYDGAPILEIGRSFVVPEYQKNHVSLHLLWCGIGRYLTANPRYRSVYGVVSMSRLYDPRTMAAIRDALVEPLQTVEAKAVYDADLGDLWHAYLNAQQPLAMQQVSKIVRAMEADERDVPVLIRHYHKLGARFVSAAVDGSFNNTPGLLLCLDVPQIPQKYLKQYLGERLPTYLDYQG